APLAALLVGLYQGEFRGRPLLWYGLIATSAVIVANVTCIVAGLRTAEWIAAGRLAGPVAAFAFLVIRAREKVRAGRRSHDQVAVRTLLPYSTAGFLSAASAAAISQLDVFFLSGARGTRTAGVYAPASRLADLSISVAPIVGAFLLPALSRLVQ